MNEAARIALVINDALPNIKSGTLIFFGGWFGKPYDNYYVIISAEAEDDRLIVTFKENEKLTVFNPSGSKISEKEFEIRTASRVYWQWYYYGRPQVPANLFYLDYQVENEEVKVSTNVDRYTPELTADLSMEAVRMYSAWEDL